MKLDQSEWPQQPKPTGSGDQLTKPKDEWGRDAQIYLTQIRAKKVEAEVEAAAMLAEMSRSQKDCSNILQILRRFGLFYRSYYAGLRKS